MYTIGQFSKIAKTTVPTLRFYDEMGLLKPEYVDTQTGYRYYTSLQLIPVHKIIFFRQLGMSVEQIKRVLDGEAEFTLLEERKEEINQEIYKLKHQLLQISTFEKQQNDCEYIVVEKKLRGGLVYSKTTVIENNKPTFMSNFIQGVEKKIFEYNPTMKMVSPDYCFLRYIDDVHKQNSVKVEYCQAVNKRGNEIDGIIFKEIPSVNAVCCYVRGARERLQSVADYLYEWIRDNDYIVTGSLRESFIDGPWNRDNVEDYLMEIQIPVKKERKTT